MMALSLLSCTLSKSVQIKGSKSSVSELKCCQFTHPLGVMIAVALHEVTCSHDTFSYVDYILHRCFVVVISKITENNQSGDS